MGPCNTIYPEWWVYSNGKQNYQHSLVNKLCFKQSYHKIPSMTWKSENFIAWWHFCIGNILKYTKESKEDASLTFLIKSHINLEKPMHSIINKILPLSKLYGSKRVGGFTSRAMQVNLTSLLYWKKVHLLV